MQASTKADSGSGRCGPSRRTFTPNGFEVIVRSFLIRSRNAGGAYPPHEIMPRPPALLTAAAKSRPAISGPIGAPRTGASISKSSHNRVRSIIPPPTHNSAEHDTRLLLYRIPSLTREL